MSEKGQCYVVPTPIGHLDDMTLRALDTLKKVDFIAAEDTRHSQYLLKHYNIEKPLISLHQHNEKERIALLLSRLRSGLSMALVTDAGTPTICDPGYLVVRALQDAGIQVIPLPGPCALVTALSASGLPGNPFYFAGFLSTKEQARKAFFTKWQYAQCCVIFYEAPHRILAVLREMQAIFTPDREIVLAKELTKTFETIYRGNIASVLSWLLEDELRQKGEFLVIIGPGSSEQDQEDKAIAFLDVLIQEGLPLSQAVSIAAKLSGQKRNYLYHLAMTRYNGQ